MMADCSQSKACSFRNYKRPEILATGITTSFYILSLLRRLSGLYRIKQAHFGTEYVLLN